MLSNEAFVALLLASRFATAAYIPSQSQSINQEADEIESSRPEPVITEVGVITEDHASPTFTYDPQPSLTYNPEPLYTYDSLLHFSYDPVHTEGELRKRDNETLSHPAPNLTAIPSAFRTTPFNKISMSSLLDPDGPAPPNPTPSASAFRTHPISSTSLLDLESPPPPNPTATPSAFRTKPLSSISIKSILDPNGVAPPDPTATPSAFRTRPLSGLSITFTLNPDSPAPANPTAIPSAFRTTPISSLSISFTLDPNSPAPPLTTPTTKVSTTRPATIKDDPIAAALLSMTQIGHQDNAPTLLPIQVAPTTSTLEIFRSTSVPGAIGPRPLTPTIINGGTAWVPSGVSRTSLNNGKASSVPTTAFQFVSPGNLLTYSAPSTMIAWSLTGKGGTEGGWSVYTTTLPTGMAKGELTSEVAGVTGSSYLGFVDVGRSSTTTKKGVTVTRTLVNKPKTSSADESQATEKVMSMEQGPKTTSSATEKSSKTASASSADTTCTSHAKSSSVSKKTSTTSITAPSTREKISTSSSSTPKTATTVASGTTSEETSSSRPAQMIGKDVDEKHRWTGDIRCVYPTPGCDKN